MRCLVSTSGMTQLFLIAFSISLLGADASVIQTTYGPIRGTYNNGMSVFLGIPYAAPPIGDLRFRPPQPHIGWKSILNVTQYGKSCVHAKTWNTDQGDYNRQSEDCLTINVVAPNITALKRDLPVMVYIHAGEFIAGSSNDLESNWPYFGQDEAIFVSFNWRAGTLGFLAFDELRHRHPRNGTGNYGILDQRFALQWVRDNIGAFGGDRSNVLIWGESSGGTSVGYHLVAEGASETNLFQKAILESPGLTQVKTFKDVHQNGQWLLAGLAAFNSSHCIQENTTYLEFAHTEIFSKNCLRVRENESLKDAKTWCSDNSTCMGFWRNTGSNVTYFLGTAKPPFDFHLVDHENEANKGWYARAYVKSGPSGSALEACLLNAAPFLMQDLTVLGVPNDDTFWTDSFAPTIDGVDLKEPILDSIYNRRVASNVDILLGTNLDEGTQFMNMLPQISCSANASDLNKWATGYFGRGIGSNVSVLYRPQYLERPIPTCGNLTGEKASYHMAAMRAAGDAAIRCTTRLLASRAPRRAFQYHFTQTPNCSRNTASKDIPGQGSFHGAEVPFAFGYPSELCTETDKALSRAMGCYWLSFAKYGTPDNVTSKGCQSLPSWPDYNSGKSPVMKLSSNIHMETEDSLIGERCSLFEALYHKAKGPTLVLV